MNWSIKIQPILIKIRKTIKNKSFKKESEKKPVSCWNHNIPNQNNPFQSNLVTHKLDKISLWPVLFAKKKFRSNKLSKFLKFIHKH